MSTPPPPPPPSSPNPPAGDFGGYGEFDRPAGSSPGAPDGRTVPPAWKRIVARLLDGVIVNMIIGFFIIRSIAGDGAGTVAGTGSDVDGSRLFLATVLVLVISFAWDAVATRLFGGTPMKRAFGMRVVQAESGADVEWRHAVIRWGTVAVWSIIPILSFIAPLILVITSLVFLFTKPLRQAVWDLAAKTVVVDG